VLEKVADTARTVIPGAEEVSVTLVVNDRPETAGFTGPLALALDERQYAAGFGPCLDAARGGELMIVEDMATENRWPRYAPAALELGARSSLSVPLPVLEHVVGALNVYATRAGVFDAEAARLGTVLAGYAAVAVANARVFLATADAAEGMRQAMASRAVIEQAKVIVMARLGCSADEAFGHLSKASQHANRKLRDVAAEMVAAVQARRGR
jgi:GAF domain-containing protein